MLAICVSTLSLAAPSQITLAGARFHVPHHYESGLFEQGETHIADGVATVSGGDLTVKNGTSRYAIHLGPGTPFPWYNKSNPSGFSYDYATTNLTYGPKKLPVFAKATLYFVLNTTGALGKPKTKFDFLFSEPKVPEPEVVGELLYGDAPPSPPPPSPPSPPSPPPPPSPPSPPPLRSIELKNVSFTVPHFYEGGLFKLGDVHTVSGVAGPDGGTLAVHCANCTLKDYTVTLGVGEWGPWFNHSAAFPWLEYKNATTSLNFTKFAIDATAKIYYTLNHTSVFGKPETTLSFSFTEPGSPSPEVVGELDYRL